jgi:RNA polymerase sigma-70 factor (ECF subfamily)
MPSVDLPADTTDPVDESSDAVMNASVTETRELDVESAEWLRDLGERGIAREQAMTRLHELLLRIARSELRRRSGQHPITGPELDDLAHQATADALLAITAKLEKFRGESRFTTWAYKFVILEVSAKLGRHFWQRPTVALETEDWDKLPDRFGMGPADQAQWHDLVIALRRAVEEELSERQRQVFVAIVLNGVPLDTLVVQMGSNRNAIYKTMFDARRKLRAALAANGYSAASGDPIAGVPADVDTGKAIMTDWDELDRFLQTDPRDVGCEQAMQILHVYVELIHENGAEDADTRSGEAGRRYPGVAAHLAACGPCGEDFHGLLAAIGANS